MSFPFSARNSPALGISGVPSLTVGSQISHETPSFALANQTTLVPEHVSGSGTPTFTRASVKTQIDLEAKGNQALSGEWVTQGARRVRNYVTQSDTFNSLGGGAYSITAGQTDPLGGTTAYRLKAIIGGNVYFETTSYSLGTAVTRTTSIWMKRVTGTGEVNMSRPSATLTSILTTSWQRFTATGTDDWGFSLRLLALNDEVDIWHPQYELVTGQASTAPAEYVSNGTLSAPYHGAGVDGVKYFSTLNGNTVSSNVVTEATGVPIVTGAPGVAASAPVDAGGPFGYLNESAATQLVTPTADISDMTQVTWPVVTMTTAFTSTGATGVANSATRLTATGANATILHLLVAAASSRTYSIWARRVTGTGTIKLFQAASKSADLAASLNTSTYTQLQFNANVDVTLLGYGIEIGTSGDAIDVWVNQFEAGTTATSPITTAGATRVADGLTFPTAGNIVGTQGSFYAEITSAGLTGNDRYLLVLADNNQAVYLRQTSGGDLSIYDGATEVHGGAVFTTPNVIGKVAASWGGSTMQVTLNGAAVTSGAFDGDMNTGASFGIGNNITSLVRSLNGTIRNLKIWTVKQSDAALQAMTTP